MPVEPRITIGTSKNTINSNPDWILEESSQSYRRLNPLEGNVFGRNDTVPLTCPICRQRWEATESNGNLYQQIGEIRQDHIRDSEIIEQALSRQRFNVQPCGHLISQEWAAAYAAERVARSRGSGQQRIEGIVRHEMQKRAGVAWRECQRLINVIAATTQSDFRYHLLLRLTLMLNELTLCGDSVTLQVDPNSLTDPRVAAWAFAQTPAVWYPGHLPVAISAVRANPLTAVILDANGFTIGPTEEQMRNAVPHLTRSGLEELRQELRANRDEEQFRRELMGDFPPTDADVRAEQRRREREAEQRRREREAQFWVRTLAPQAEAVRPARPPWTPTPISTPIPTPAAKSEPEPVLPTIEELNEEFFRSMERKPRRIRIPKNDEESE